MGASYLIKRVFIVVVIFLITFLNYSCIKEEQVIVEGCNGVSFVQDPRDSKSYKIMQIGSQCFFAEDIRYYDNNINQYGSDLAWSSLWNNGVLKNVPAWCTFNNIPTYFSGAEYGLLYNWNAVKTGTICPPGWHIPSKTEWETLTTFLGGAASAGGKMKSQSGWLTPNIMATNESGFSALPSGYRDITGKFLNRGRAGYWWSSTEVSANYAWSLLVSNEAATARVSEAFKQNGFTCRCVRNF